MSYRRFSDCSVSEKLLDTMFICIIGMGYFFAMVLIYGTISPLDGKPGLSAADIRIKYYGSRSGTRLENALNGIMKEYHSKEEHDIIVRWIYAGADRAGFEQKVAPIMQKTCGKCHRPDTGMPEFSSYEKVMTYVTIDTGEALLTLVRVSHIHLFGLAMLFFILGKIFLLNELPIWLKRVMVIIPFFSIVIDIGSWWITKVDYVFAYAVMGGGVLMGVSFAFQALVSLYQIWFYRPKGDSERGGDRRSERRRV